MKNHWNSTLKRRRAEYAPGGPLDVSAITAALQRRLACAGADDGAQGAQVGGLHLYLRAALALGLGPGLQGLGVDALGHVGLVVVSVKILSLGTS